MPKNLHIIIADDHRILRSAVKELLHKAYPLAIMDEAADATELLAKLSLKKYDLVISDVQMPGESGIEALSKIKKQYPGLPVLIISSYPENDYALRALEAGASAYLGKELLHEHLLPAVQKALMEKIYITNKVSRELLNHLKSPMNKPSLSILTKRELEVYHLLSTGKSTTAIAKLLLLSLSSISGIKKRILTKMNLTSAGELVIYAFQHQPDNTWPVG